MKDEIVLRPASQADSEFVYQIKKTTLRKYVEQIWGWDESWQREYHRDRFDPSDMYIVLSGPDQIGVLAFTAYDSSVYVRLICLDPRYQNRGIGSFLMEGPIEEARSRGVPVTLGVLKPNPAMRFYEKLGFRIVSEDDIRYCLERG
jgi:ribosomal protein S18 acetylase RimI-like enzyme